MPTFFSKVFSRGKDKDKDKDKEREKEKDASTPSQGVKDRDSKSASSGSRANSKEGSPKQGKRASIQSLLEGKFEAVSPTVSPSVQRFDEKDKVLGKDKEKPAGAAAGGLFRPKSRMATGAGGGRGGRKSASTPQLKLDIDLPLGEGLVLASPKDGDARGREFDALVLAGGGEVLDDATLGARRLCPEEALKLMQACKEVIISRGASFACCPLFTACM